MPPRDDYQNDLQHALVALEKVSARIDERVIILLANQKDLAEGHKELDRKLDAVGDALHANDVRLVKLEDETNRDNERWKNWTGIIVRVLEAVGIAWVIWKFGIK